MLSRKRDHIPGPAGLFLSRITEEAAACKEDKSHRVGNPSPQGESAGLKPACGSQRQQEAHQKKGIFPKVYPGFSHSNSSSRQRSAARSIICSFPVFSVYQNVRSVFNGRCEQRFVIIFRNYCSPLNKPLRGFLWGLDCTFLFPML